MDTQRSVDLGRTVGRKDGVVGRPMAEDKQAEKRNGTSNDHSDCDGTGLRTMEAFGRCVAFPVASGIDDCDSHQRAVLPAGMVPSRMAGVDRAIAAHGDDDALSLLDGAIGRVMCCHGEPGHESDEA